MSEPPVSWSGEWIRRRTDDELDELINGSMPGRVFDALTAEAARRSGQRSERRQLFWIRLTFWTALAIGVAGIAATLLR